MVRYTGEFVCRWAPDEMVVGRFWRAPETYIKVKGGWMLLYRAVDERARTVASYLSRTRALRLMVMLNEFNLRWDNPVKIRSCKYLNNNVEQDHRRVKSRLSAMLGFKSFHNARVVIAGIELIDKLEKASTCSLLLGLCPHDVWSNGLAA